MMRTPDRRKTLGAAPSSQRNQGTEASKATSKSRLPPKGRLSMIPRVGRENAVPSSPSPSLTSHTSASRRRRSNIGGSGTVPIPPPPSPANPSRNRRRSSVGVGGLGGKDRRLSNIPPPIPAIKADPRPINEKSFQTQCIRRLYNFLMANAYEYPLSQKTLLRPSAKDFNNICSFMLRLVDRNFQEGSPLKFEEEVALSFKAMGYPYTISKTSLVAAGSPHTWPSLLAALTWLMEHIECIQAHVTGEDFDPVDVFSQYLMKAHRAYEVGDQQTIDQLEVELAERFDEDRAALTEEKERIDHENEVILERIDGLKRGSEE